MRFRNLTSWRFQFRLLQMKNSLSVTLLTLSLAQGSVSCNRSVSKTNVNASRTQYASVNNNQAGGRSVTLKGQGMSLTFPIGWRKDDESIEAGHIMFAWRGPDNTRFAVSIGMYKPEDKPEYGNRSIDDEANSFLKGSQRCRGSAFPRN